MLQLHPYQFEGAGFLADRPRAYLADEPGLGKTAQVICAADWLELKTGVVICPAFLRTNWTREFAKWSDAGRTVAAWVSSKDKPPEADVVCVSYDLAGKAVFGRWVEKFKPDFMVCDEAHALKNRTAKRTMAILGRAKSQGHMRHAKHFWLLSGTPMLGTADDLYTPLKAFGAYTGSWHQFVDEFTSGYVGDYGYKVTGNKNVAGLQKLMAPYLLRRKLEDVDMQLPNLSVQTVMVDPLETNPGNSAIMELETWERYIRDIMGNRADILDRYKQITPQERAKMVEARQIVGMLKVRSYASLINDELFNWTKDKVVIFAIHRGVIKGLRIFLEAMGYRPGVIWGGTPMDQREKLIEKFQNKADGSAGRVLICNINAAGTGLNITGARYVDIVEASWTPAENEQAIKRLHRIGQEQKVTARFVGLAGSVDEYITEVLAKKISMINEIIG